jgi:FAD/FMN-containing dehydrogenase
MIKEIKRDLEQIVGPKRVTDNEGACWAYAFNDFGSYFNPPFVGGKPDIVVKPSSTEEVSAIMKVASKTKTPLVPAGGREGVSGGSVPSKGGILLDLTLMDKVISISEKSSAVRAQAGITYTKLRDRVKKEGYFLGNQGPAGPMGGTLGGGIALHSTGLGGAHYGQYGENVLAMEVVLSNGDIITTGSLSNPECDWYHRYCCGFDATGLFIGSAGSLGVITEAAIKLHALPLHERTRNYWFKDIDSACRTLHEQDKYEWLYNHMVTTGRHSIAMTFPPGTPAAKLIPEEAESVLTIQMRGYDEVVLKRQCDIMDEIAVKGGGSVVELPLMPEDPLMVARLAGIGLTCFCEIIYPILQAPALCNYVIHEFIPRHQDMMIKLPGTPIPFWMMMLAGLTNHSKTDFTFIYGVDVSDKEKREEARKVYHDLLSFAYSSYGGGAPHAMAKDMYTPHWREQVRPEYIGFLKTIKHALDPDGILNPGNLLAE